MNNGRLTPFQGPRLILTGAIMFTTLLVLLARLYYYQVNKRGDFLLAESSNSIQNVPLAAPRGAIYDRYGVPLAVNSPAFEVTVTPAYLPDDPNKALDVLNRLSSLIGIPATRAAADAAGLKNIYSLAELVQQGQGIAPYRAVIVKSDVAETIAQEILQDKQQLPGIDVQWAGVRQYPTGALTSQLVGYLGPIGQAEANRLRDLGYDPTYERTGYAGIEASMNTILAGTRGNLTRKRDVAGRPVDGGLVSETPAVPGENVRLTIDVQLQQAAQQAFINERNFINAIQHADVTDSGVVIAMDPNTGEILAMVSWPTYDNSKFARAIDGVYYNQLTQSDQNPLVNHAVGSLYPPGSTWKILTATAVDQEQVIAPDSTLFDSGSLTVKNSFAPNDTARAQKFVCWLRTGHGEVNLIKAISQSCDVYFYQVGGGNPDVSAATLRPGGLGITNLDRYAAAYGIGEQTWVQVPGAVAGLMPDPTWKRRYYGQSWSTGDTYNAAFGQGYVTVSPLQLLNVASTIANTGTEYQPTLVRDFEDAAGTVLQPFQKTVMRTLTLPADTTLTPAVIHLEEDMRVKGMKSVACVCELNSVAQDAKSFDTYNTDPTLKSFDDYQNHYRADFLNTYGMSIPDPNNTADANAKITVCDPKKITSSYRAMLYSDRNMTPMYDPATGKLSDGAQTQIFDSNGNATTETAPLKQFNFIPVNYGVYVPFDYDFTDGLCNADMAERFDVTNMTPEQFTQANQPGGIRMFEPPTASGDNTSVPTIAPTTVPTTVSTVISSGATAVPTAAPTSAALTSTPLAGSYRALSIGYQPPFISTDVYHTVQTGMAETTQPGGTAGPNFVPLEGQPAVKDLIGYNIPGHPEITTAGKTGTAEYCDQIAQAHNLCIPGSWPSHGWFTGYAPTTNPQIAVVALVYHGGEGSIVAMPIVREVTTCFFFLKSYRDKGQQPPDCPVNPNDEPVQSTTSGP